VGAVDRRGIALARGNLRASLGKSHA
jgi:hypothetical protein